ncbi:hypothetical protein SAMN02910398_04105 [Butyrivibrio sp. YAB3001]|nr:hypothetical protein SAMN02910398_04105 [Butyrivibrio sp. YAB3001]
MNGHISDISSEEKPIESILPVIGKDFENVELIDARDMIKMKSKYRISGVETGSFDGIDKELQMVEMDKEIVPVPEFPYNWYHSEKSTGVGSFKMNITCSKLLLLFKDSGNPAFGTAQVFVDGKLVMEADPLKVGWTHCNAVIIFNNEKTESHSIEIKMAEGMENKRFTILGFGVVA